MWEHNTGIGGDVTNMTRTRFTYRPSEYVYEAASKSAKKKGISINSEINQILATYFDFMESHPGASVWNEINAKESKGSSHET